MLTSDSLKLLNNKLNVENMQIREQSKIWHFVEEVICRQNGMHTVHTQINKLVHIIVKVNSVKCITTCNAAPSFYDIKNPVFQ